MTKALGRELAGKTEMQRVNDRLVGDDDEKERQRQAKYRVDAKQSKNLV